ncbi:ribonuclease HII [Gammaproteobacteria bacterium SCGC AG-212-F23]|nr:ribonuclease HII [Gammaproteobacteria bacterium SCGC AG-212-F23]
MEKLLIAGVDEAGRGPLAGPVYAGAVILNPKFKIKGLADSKLLTEKKREQLFEQIQIHALAWGVGFASVEEIDRMNILQASLLAMQRAVASLTVAPELILVDGNFCPAFDHCETRAIIGGDSLEPAISAASIIAKVSRDREMILLDQQFPHYGFAQHKGYPTRAHFAALKKFGASVVHRRSYAPVAAVL